MTRRRARGEGSIRKRKDGRWEGRYTIGRDDETGKFIYRSVLAKTQIECKKKLHEAMQVQQEDPRSHEKKVLVDKVSEMEPQHALGQVNEKNKTYTVGEWLGVWYEIYSKPNLRKSTQIQYKYFLMDIVSPRIGQIPIENLTGLQLQRLYQDLRKDGKIRKPGNFDPGLSAKTVRSIHMLLHCFFNQAVKEGLIPKNPTDDCKPPKVERREMRVIQPDQISSYLRAAANHNVLPMFYLELTSGLRKGELLALLWSDLDVKQCSISITKTMSRREGTVEVSPPKTKNSIRRIVISEQTVELLLEEHSQHPQNPYMFPSPVTGMMYDPDAVGRIHKKLLKEAGLEDCRFHDLRHTFATLALQNGVDIKTLSGILGHTSSGFTLDTYTHVTPKMQQDAANKIDQFMKMNM
ncbi:tyrosine-type recombinase/integrase [Dysosmobacter sp. Phy]